MNMPALPVISPSQPPTESPARATDASTPGSIRTFSKVLSQQQERPASRSQSGSAAHASNGQPRDDKARDPLDPDSTLSLILDSTALPLMQALIQTPAGTLPGIMEAETAQLPPASAAQADPRSPAAPAAALLVDLTASLQKPPGKATSVAGRQAHADTSRSGKLESLLAPATALPTGEEALASNDRGGQSGLAQTAAALTQQAEGSKNPRAAALQVLTAVTPSGRDNAANTPLPAAADAQAALFGAAATAAGLPPIPTTTQSSMPVITLAVPTPLASAQWAQDLGRQLVSVAQLGPNGTHTVQLHVNPPELGPVHITLQVGDSLTQAAFVSPHAHVRQALENALPRLEQQFAQAGLSLGQANVSDQQAGQQGFAQSSASPRNASVTTINLETTATGAAPLVTHTPNPARHPDALVDTFA